MCCFRVVSKLSQRCVSLQVCEIGRKYVLLEGLQYILTGSRNAKRKNTVLKYSPWIAKL
jgi:hypothetical protein